MRTIRLAFFAVTMLLVGTAAFAQQFPKPTGYVNDFAHLLSRNQAISLNAELASFEELTKVEIAVVTVRHLGDRNIEDYARELGKEWGVGKRGLNNGVVFLIAPKERKMRIETASGARTILTDSRTDQIRDEIILPRFKDGDMAQGIIDGAEAIMRSFDAPSSVVAINEVTPFRPESTSSDWTDKDTDHVVDIVGGIILIALVLMLIIPPIRRSKALKDVMAGKNTVASGFINAENLAKNSDVKDESRGQLAKLKIEFSSIDQLTAQSVGVDWILTRDRLDLIEAQLITIVSDMREAIEFAEEAQREGPELMKKIPDMIKAAEKKLAEGEQSEEAVKHLKEAQDQYAQAQAQQSDMGTMNWVLLYMLLNNSQSSIENAESAHAYANTDDTPSSSFSSIDSGSPSSLGFGDSGGFGGGSPGGGGGFGGGSGGSTGSW